MTLRTDTTFLEAKQRAKLDLIQVRKDLDIKLECLLTTSKSHEDYIQRAEDLSGLQQHWCNISDQYVRIFVLSEEEGGLAAWHLEYLHGVKEMTDLGGN